MCQRHLAFNKQESKLVIVLNLIAFLKILL